MGVRGFKDDLYHHVLDRFHRFHTPERCGRWNEHLLADFSNDSRFYSDARNMIDAHVSAALPMNGPVEDGLDVGSVVTDIGRLIRIRFHYWLLDPCAACPATYSLTVINDRIHRVEFACGHRNEDGTLKYRYADKHHGRFESFPEHQKSWAIYFSRDYVIVSDHCDNMSTSADHAPLQRVVKRHRRSGG